MQTIVSHGNVENAGQQAAQDARVLDLVIIGGGVSGMAAALEARRAGLSFEILESTEAFSRSRERLRL